jgi:multisubunit Na+/H+ antiporter MnhF subunit
MSGPLAVAVPIAAVLLAVAVVLTGWRMLWGPGFADRSVALDLLGLLAVTGTALVAVGSGHLALLDVALGLGLVGFVGAVGLAAFMVRASRDPRKPEVRDE